MNRDDVINERIDISQKRLSRSRSYYNRIACDDALTQYDKWQKTNDALARLQFDTDITAFLEDSSDFGVICLCAVRYALGRHSYMPSLVQDFIMRNISLLHTNTIELMIRDITEFLGEWQPGQDKSFFDDIDNKGWKTFSDRLKTIINKNN